MPPHERFIFPGPYVFALVASPSHRYGGPPPHAQRPQLVRIRVPVVASCLLLCFSRLLFSVLVLFCIAVVVGGKCVFDDEKSSSDVLKFS
jgi:hypothetical protein